MKRPSQIQNLEAEIRKCIDEKRYTQSLHALKRQRERKIDLVDALYVLKHGYHEKIKTVFDEKFCTWKYAMRGKTLEGLDIRVIISFLKKDMFIITVMHVKRSQS